MNLGNRGRLENMGRESMDIETNSAISQTHLGQNIMTIFLRKTDGGDGIEHRKIEVQANPRDYVAPGI